MSYAAAAEMLARNAHFNQVDLAGLPYITHVQRVVQRVEFCGDDVIAVAWLHDVVEDTEVTLAQIAAVFPPEIVQGVDAMTQREGEPLESYWARVKANRLAFIVKLHGDMPDNNDPNRPGPTEAQRLRIRSKYVRAINFFATNQEVQAPPPSGRDAKRNHLPQDDLPIYHPNRTEPYDVWHMRVFGTRPIQGTD